MSSTEVRVKGGGYVRQVWWLGHLMLVWEGIRGELPWFLIQRWKWAVFTQCLETSAGCLGVKELR